MHAREIDCFAGKKMKMCLEESHGSAVEQGSVEEPGAHHPAQVGGPRHNITPPDVLLCPSVHPTAHGRDVRPGNGLRFAWTKSTPYYIRMANGLNIACLKQLDTFKLPGAGDVIRPHFLSDNTAPGAPNSMVRAFLLDDWHLSCPKRRGCL